MSVYLRRVRLATGCAGVLALLSAAGPAWAGEAEAEPVRLTLAVARDLHGPGLRAEGSTDLPDGASVHLRLELDGAPVPGGRRTVPAGAGRFSAFFPFQSAAVLPGVYRICALRDGGNEPDGSADLRLGSPEEEASRRLEFAGWLGQLTDEFRTLAHEASLRFAAFGVGTAWTAWDARLEELKTEVQRLSDPVRCFGTYSGREVGQFAADLAWLDVVVGEGRSGIGPPGAGDVPTLERHLQELVERLSCDAPGSGPRDGSIRARFRDWLDGARALAGQIDSAGSGPDGTAASAVWRERWESLAAAELEPLAGIVEFREHAEPRGRVLERLREAIHEADLGLAAPAEGREGLAEPATAEARAATAAGRATSAGRAIAEARRTLGTLEAMFDADRVRARGQALEALATLEAGIPNPESPILERTADAGGDPGVAYHFPEFPAKERAVRSCRRELSRLPGPDAASGRLAERRRYFESTLRETLLRMRAILEEP